MLLSDIIKQVSIMLEEGGDGEFNFSLSRIVGQENSHENRSPEVPPAQSFTPQSVEQRLSVCRQCPHMRALKLPLLGKEVMQCGKCHCIINIKASIQFTSCPIGQW